jgi:hypothetical protein
LTLTPSGKTKITVGLRENFQVKQIEYSLIVQGEDAFQDKDMRGIDGVCLVLSSMLFE